MHTYIHTYIHVYVYIYSMLVIYYFSNLVCRCRHDLFKNILLEGTL